MHCSVGLGGQHHRLSMYNEQQRVWGNTTCNVLRHVHENYGDTYSCDNYASGQVHEYQQMCLMFYIHPSLYD